MAYSCRQELGLVVSISRLNPGPHTGIGLLAVCEGGSQQLQLCLQLVLLPLELADDVRHAEFSPLLLQSLQPCLDLHEGFPESSGMLMSNQGSGGCGGVLVISTPQH